MKNYKLIPKIALIALSVLGVLFVLLFFLGGNSAEEPHVVAGESMPYPRFDDAFLMWIYILVGVGLLITFASAMVSFIRNWKYNRRKAYMTFGVVCGFIALALICWFAGSPEKINIIGYEGTDNEGAWAQMSDAVIYACYTLIVATIGTMIWGYCYTKKLSK